VSATALGLIGLFNAFGTYSFGLLGARYSQKRLLALIYLLRTLFIVAFLAMPISTTSTLIFAAAMGSLWLGVSPLVTGILAACFGLTHFGTLYGVVFLQPPGRLVLRRVDGRDRVRPHGQLRLRLGRADRDRLTAFTLQWLMDDRSAPCTAGIGDRCPRRRERCSRTRSFSSLASASRRMPARISASLSEA
jgi:hypothetical protein